VLIDVVDKHELCVAKDITNPNL
jgi:hypothetical protein